MADVAPSLAPVASRGGRPSREAAQQLRERILEAATELMLEQGYGATSIEAVATRAGVSKRTFYHRFADKAELVQAVVGRVVQAARPPEAVTSAQPDVDLESALQAFGAQVLRAALSPRVLALYRLIVAESHRFPDLLVAVAMSGGRAQAVAQLVGLLQRNLPHVPADDAEFAAQQFLQMLVSLPQIRALGIGEAMSPTECDQWVRRTVRLLLQGLQSPR